MHLGQDSGVVHTVDDLFSVPSQSQDTLARMTTSLSLRHHVKQNVRKALCSAILRNAEINLH